MSGADAWSTGRWRAAGSLGSATGGLVGEWLTPQRLEECFAFWGEGAQLYARDVARGRVRSVKDVQAALWLLAYADNTFPFTPLLLPLVDRALEERAPKLPAAFSESRLAAFQRLQRQRDDGFLLEDAQ
eukprot:247053-Rhodomonas_salina.1